MLITLFLTPTLTAEKTFSLPAVGRCKQLNPSSQSLILSTPGPGKLAKDRFQKFYEFKFPNGEISTFLNIEGIENHEDLALQCAKEMIQVAQCSLGTIEKTYLPDNSVTCRATVSITNPPFDKNTYSGKLRGSCKSLDPSSKAFQIPNPIYKFSSRYKLDIGHEVKFPNGEISLSFPNFHSETRQSWWVLQNTNTKKSQLATLLAQECLKQVLESGECSNKLRDRFLMRFIRISGVNFGCLPRIYISENQKSSHEPHAHEIPLPVPPPPAQDVFPQLSGPRSSLMYFLYTDEKTRQLLQAITAVDWIDRPLEFKSKVLLAIHPDRNHRLSQDQAAGMMEKWIEWTNYSPAIRARVYKEWEADEDFRKVWSK